MITIEEKVMASPILPAGIGEKYANKWVAFSPDYKKVIDADDSLTALDRKIGDSRAVFTKILPDVFFAPITLLR